ncbi:GAF domain-containing protein [Comamonas sp. JC664]|uniref:GAF domain-containing protein n=1 Tax=Comamonas sp. JC664 TaxID=2801917 RepID=UPI0036221520
MAGRGTDTLAASDALYVPLMAPVRARGVLVLQLRTPERLRVPEERRLLDACASQIALALERVHFVEVAQQTQVAMEGERMRNTLLSSVSHDLRTPLTSILGAAQAGLPHAPPARRKTCCCRFATRPRPCSSWWTTCWPWPGCSRTVCTCSAPGSLSMNWWAVPCASSAAAWPITRCSCSCRPTYRCCGSMRR